MSDLGCCNDFQCRCEGYIEGGTQSKWSKGMCRICNHPKSQHWNEISNYDAVTVSNHHEEQKQNVIIEEAPTLKETALKPVINKNDSDQYDLEQTRFKIETIDQNIEDTEHDDLVENALLSHNQDNDEKYKLKVADQSNYKDEFEAVGYDGNNDKLQRGYDGLNDEYDDIIDGKLDVDESVHDRKDEEGNNVIREGYMSKQGKKFKTWKRRYFILFDQGKLSYYDKKGDENPIFSVNIKLMKYTQRALFGKNKQYGLQIDTKKRIWKFVCQSEEDLAEWMDAFNLVTKGIRNIDEAIAEIKKLKHENQKLRNIIREKDEVIAKFENEEKQTEINGELTDKEQTDEADEDIIAKNTLNVSALPSEAKQNNDELPQNIDDNYSGNNKVFINCRQFKELKCILMNMRNNTINIDEVDINKVMNNHLFLSTNDEYSNDEIFECMFNEFGGDCNIDKCIMFGRNYRNRNLYPLNRYKGDIAKIQILDKIHCHYFHSFDIGNKLKLCERESIANDDIKLNERLTKKRKKYITNEQIDRLNGKFNQLQSSKKGSNNNNNNKMYCFGVEFNYDGEYTRKGSDFAIDIGKKYDSLKEELINNQVSNIAINQYDVEYKKAEIHFNSLYRREYYGDMNIECILSLMIYCNYDELQRKFSATYRDKIHEHIYFYHLGKFLKRAVHKFGIQIDNGLTSLFYHGIGEELTLPAVVNDVCIYCPLSTSSSFEVATNFTNNNNGLIIKFASMKGYDVKYFSVSWLSDYSNESEHLFIQNEGPLEILNIINATSNVSYDGILKGLKHIENLMNGGHTFNDNYSKWVGRIIEHQLSNTFKDEYKSIKSLDKYAKKMINKYFENKTKVTICHTTNSLYSFLYGILFASSGQQWCNIDILIALFPNVEIIEIKNISLRRIILENIFKCLQKNCYGNNNKLKTISIIRNKNVYKGLDVKCAVSEYSDRFKRDGFNINIDDNRIDIHRINNNDEKQDLLLQIIDNKRQKQKPSEFDKKRKEYNNVSNKRERSFWIMCDENKMIDIESLFQYIQHFGNEKPSKKVIKQFFNLMKPNENDLVSFSKFVRIIDDDGDVIAAFQRFQENGNPRSQ